MKTKVVAEFPDCGSERVAVTALMCALVVAVGSLGCGSDNRFEPMPLDASADTYRNKMWTRSSAVKIEKSGTDLHCEVQAEADVQNKSEAIGEGEGKTGTESKKEMYGGIAFPAPSATGWRLELGFPEPESILRVYVAAYNAKSERICSWQTPWRAKLKRERATYEFELEKEADGFERNASGGQGPVHKIHVYMRVKPGSRASLDLHSVHLAR